MLPAAQFLAGKVRAARGELYATLNMHIGEGAAREHAAHLRGHFHLARIKHAFLVYYRTRDGARRCDKLSGEMLDLSQSHGVAHDELRRGLYAEVATPYRDYPILGVDPRVVVLHSYSPRGFLADLRSMLHHTETAPPRARKVARRLARYVGMLFVVVLSPLTEAPRARKLAALRALVDGRARVPAASRRTGWRPSTVLARERRSLARTAPCRGPPRMRALRNI